MSSSASEPVRVRWLSEEDRPTLVAGEAAGGSAAQDAASGTARLNPALALRFLAGEVRARGRIDPATGDRDDVQRSVDLTVAAAVKAVAVVSPGRHWDRCDAGHPGEVGVGLETLGARGLPDQDAAVSGPQPVS